MRSSFQHISAISFRVLHRGSAIMLALFLLIHLGNHFAGLGGQDTHIMFMEVVRRLYRNALVEPILIALILFQLGTGLTMAIRGWRARSGFVAWLQAVSGLYLAAFLIIHTASVLLGRYSMHLDTNFNFAAAGFHVSGWPWYFVPYYFLAVASLFVHIGCALYWTLVGGQPIVARWLLGGLTIAGIMSGGLFVLMLSGYLYRVVIPLKYLATYAQ